MTGQTLNGTVNTIPVNGQTNQLTSAVYDANGNMTTGAGAPTLTYDVGNRLTSAAEVSGGIEYYGYAPDGKQVYRLLANGSEEFTLYGVQGEKLGVYAPSFNQSTGAAIFQPLRANVYFAGRVIWSDGAPAYQDRLGTNRAQGTRFLPYGNEVTSTTNDREKFGTYTRDGYTGMDYAQQRFYASTYGRFNSADPYATSGAASGSVSNPSDSMTWNRYAYVGGDPINRADPKGTDWCDGEPTEGTALVGCDSVCGDGEMLDPVTGVGCVPLGVGVFTAPTPATPDPVGSPSGSGGGSGGGSGMGSGFLPSYGNYAACFLSGVITAVGNNTDQFAAWALAEAAYLRGTPWGPWAVVVARTVGLVAIDSISQQVAQNCAVVTGYVPWRLQIEGFRLPATYSGPVVNGTRPGPLPGGPSRGGQPGQGITDPISPPIPPIPNGGWSTQ